MDIEKRLEQIEARNQKVECDKAWETSHVRKLSIMLITYICAGLFLYSIDSPNFYIAALVPVIGYYLSTLSLPILKNIWLRLRR